MLDIYCNVFVNMEFQILRSKDYFYFFVKGSKGHGFYSKFFV